MKLTHTIKHPVFNKFKKIMPVFFGLFIFAPLLGYNSLPAAFNFLDLGKKITAYWEKVKIQTSGQNQQNLDISSAPVPGNELNITQSGAKTADEYSENFITSLSKVSFTDDEFNAIKKDAKGRPFSLEEMAQRVAWGANQDYFRPSFKAWQNLDEKSIESLEKMPVSQNMASIHGAIVSWYKYYGQFAKKLAEENLSTSEIKNLYDQHQKKAGIFNQRLQMAFSNQKILAANNQNPIYQNLMSDFLSFFSNLIPEAYAIADGATYNFGGMIMSYGNLCTNGFAVIVGPPRGGLLWIYHPVYIANPFMYKILAPKVWVLGRAIWGPGVCNQGTITYPYGQAQIVFFGSSFI